MSPRVWIVLGAVSAAVAVGWGAFHAHGMEKFLLARNSDAAAVQKALQNFDVAVRYQMTHAIALILVGLLGFRRASNWFDAAAFLFVLGTLLFSGCLEIGTLLDIKTPWFLVPAGGLALIAGWISLAVAAATGKEAPRELHT